MSLRKSKELINMAISAGILQGIANRFVFVYRSKGDDNHPEGWYKNDIDTVAKELSKDINGMNLLKKELNEINTPTA